MTVKELIEELGHWDDDTEVVFAYGYGDYCRSTVTSPVKEADEAPIYWSEQHRSMRLVEPEYREDHRADKSEDGEKARQAIVLHSGVDRDLLGSDYELED